jgi:adenosylcobinamide kinase/adenosylcobinamide-phosphate guanylyltransferase
MKVTMLGTGAADGWPTPFCMCASCSTLRARGEVRGQTSALIDDRVLIDPGPEAPRSAVRAGLVLADVSLVLFTHAHPDHCHPQVLLWRRWAGLTTPITVAGPEDALDACREWVGPDDPVRWAPLLAGDELEIDGYLVRAVPASHTAGALLYDIESAAGRRLLYATDTGPLSDQAHGALAGRALDAVLLEETWGSHSGHGGDHHDLATFPETLRLLRSSGAITDVTDVVAIHLGHHNPPEPELSRILGAWSARAAHDHEVIDLGSTMPAASNVPRRTLIIGGARSGKSREAEQQVAADENVTYIATGGLRVDDPEWDLRIEKHRARRPPHWATAETTDLVGALSSAGADQTLLIDCLTLWLTAVMDADAVWDATGDHEAVLRPRMDALLDALRSTQARVVMVTNEVGQGVVPAHASGRAFRDALGALNAAVAAECDEVLVVMAGKVRAW